MNSEHSLLALLRQSIPSRLAGYGDFNDADVLALKLLADQEGSASLERIARLCPAWASG
jgi:hypothetical protein